MPWETAAYYTFSTVAQTLAGALGLVGAFVIIRTTTLGQLIRADAEDLYRDVGRVGGRNEASAAFLACDWPRLVSLYRQAHDASQDRWQGWNERHLAVLNHAEQSLKARSGLLTRVARALGLSVAVMGAAIAGLPLTPCLSRMPVLALSVLAVEALLAVVCLAWYAAIVLATLRE